MIDGVSQAMLQVPVSDQERARAFWTEIMGFQLVSDREMGSERWIKVTPPDHKVVLVLGGPAPASRKISEFHNIVYTRRVLEAPRRAARGPAEAGKPPLAARPLIGQTEATELTRLFKMLANDTRLRLVHALERAGELCVTDLARELKMAPQAVSNQLQRLTDRRIVAFRREGSRLYYRIADPCVPEFLDLGLCLLEETGELPAGKGEEPRGEGSVLGAEASHRPR